ncbi:MAG: MarR family transcriptional regulator [Pseudomonadota bacterium]
MKKQLSRDSLVQSQAKLVFTTGKMIRDRIFKTQMSGFHANARNKPLKDLSMSQFHMLMLIRSQGTVCVKDLSRYLCVSPPSASAMVERLVDKGLLVRTQSREDRRRVEISLSEKALDIMNEVEQRTFVTFVDLVEKLGPETTAQWCSVLEKIQTILKDHEES